MKIKISDRIDLYIENDGFKFTNKLTKPKHLDSWKHWSKTWVLYSNDGVVGKVLRRLRELPEHQKIQHFYQSVDFTNNSMIVKGGK